ncbi:hypothetical protein SAMN05444007_105263 [Cribrihabitans marinus]|uniref:Uncharacterized protein n=1 Tax=Cribrihabitans marinus TaxID=1227549 RepID=A0A1H6ZUX8_9RHOB|nr:hypothetical protein [Cribrihabitans marinus]GGH29957.1 hypothetical protein GCM10010973_19780 [Cribrihabitans marinus]SEJ57038.1 hypothetical protein SAMN05444007_105263 [Cribrihabitans marinus]
MPKLIRLYITHVLIGFGVAALFIGGLLWLNVGNLWHLISTSDIGLMAVFVLWFANGIVFAGVQFALAVMGMAEKKDGPRGGTPVARDPEPALVPATGRRKR